MKKSLLLILLVFLLASCATVPRTHLTPNDAAMLQGSWTGNRDMIWGRYRSFDATTLVIENNTLPLKGVLTIGMHEGRYPVSYPFENGAIDPEGNLILVLKPEIRAVLTHSNEGGKEKLYGYYNYMNMQGTLSLIKK